eukprot:Phypoly_transcript_04833.p1 GENE.Phypoly_transcript_04833~~Phypoly_transcript_04833.p1  ORF type:complete len:568 (+),score=60.31 Phypoly_transcript_04833:172-1875(+)
MEDSPTKKFTRNQTARTENFHDFDESALSCFFQTINQGMLLFLAGVNKNWRRIALDPKFWITIDIGDICTYHFSVFKKINADRVGIFSLAKRFANTLEAFLSRDIPQNYDGGRYTFFKNLHAQNIIFPKLYEIYLHPCQTQYDVLQRFLMECCPILTKCNLLLGSPIKRIFPDTGNKFVDLDHYLLDIGSSHQNKLTHFSFGIRHINGPQPGMSKNLALWENFQSVTSLILENLVLNGELLCGVLSAMANLKFLDVRYLEVTGGMRQLDLKVEEFRMSNTPAQASKVASALINRNVKRLYITYSQFDTFNHLAQHTPNLEFLKLSCESNVHFRDFSAESFALFTKNCPQVKELRLTVPSQKFPGALVHLQNLQNLQKLELAMSLSAHVLWQIFKCCTNLQELYVNSYGVDPFGKQDQTFEVQEGGFSHLCKLTLWAFNLKWPIAAMLRGAPHLTSLTLTLPFDECPKQLSLPKLQWIVIREQKPEIMVELLRAAPNLYSLELQLWESLQDIDLVIEAIRNHKNLNELLLNCWRFEAKGKQAFYNYFHKNHVDLFNGTNIYVTLKSYS